MKEGNGARMWQEEFACLVNVKPIASHWTSGLVSDTVVKDKQLEISRAQYLYICRMHPLRFKIYNKIRLYSINHIPQYFSPSSQPQPFHVTIDINFSLVNFYYIIRLGRCGIVNHEAVYILLSSIPFISSMGIYINFTNLAKGIRFG